MYEEVLKAANCSSLACLKASSQENLAHVDSHLLNDVPTLSGEGNQGPGTGSGLVVDGELITDLPMSLPNLTQRLSRLNGPLTSNMGNGASSPFCHAHLSVLIPSRAL